MRKLSSFLKSTVLFLLAVLAFLSLFSYSPKDVSLVSSPTTKPILNFIGIGGAYLGFVLFFLLGKAAYFFPFCFFFLSLDKAGVLRFSGLGRSRLVNVLAFIFFIIFLSTFLGLFAGSDTLIWQGSGMIGFFLATFFKRYLGGYGSFITIFLLMAANAVIFFGFFFIDSFKAIRHAISKTFWFLKDFKIKEQRPSIPKLKESVKNISKDIKNKLHIQKPEIKFYTPKLNAGKDKNSAAAASGPISTLAGQKSEATAKTKVKENMKDIEQAEGKTFDPLNYKLPNPEILKVPPFLAQRELKEDVEQCIKNLETTLSEFGVEAKVASVQKGPVVTMYELQPRAGVKIQQIATLADDIALAMKSANVRIVAPIPGRGTVGVEIPNTKKHFVYLREVLEEKIFTKSESKLTLTIGKDVSGNPVIADLKEMPHLLIAGATGAGKTVCVNSLISSILFKAKPDEVKFIMVDPKMVELAVFAGIPHLIHPIISEAKKAFAALNWAVEEMERRYRLLADDGSRNIDAYNKKGNKLPYIIIVIDELADLMVVARENIETSIQRLAQLSRAVGIHLVLATQRPSVDVITGVIKANFPARISFKVSSKVDSRTVLDMMGADKLIGKGDLLFLKPGAVKLIRAQGAFIDDEDIGVLTDFVRNQGKPVYEEGISEKAKKNKMKIEGDELFDEAVEIVLMARQASASLLQRRMRVGYTRAARLLDLMEQEGIVGPFCGSKAREILVDPQEYLKEKVEDD